MFPPSRIVCLTEEIVETLYLLGEQRVRIVSMSPTRIVSRTLTTRFNNAKGNCSEPT
jgi:hypothetical protein